MVARPLTNKHRQKRGGNKCTRCAMSEKRVWRPSLKAFLSYRVGRNVTDGGRTQKQQAAWADHRVIKGDNKLTTAIPSAKYSRTQNKLFIHLQMLLLSQFCAESGLKNESKLNQLGKRKLFNSWMVLMQGTFDILQLMLLFFSSCDKSEYLTCSKTHKQAQQSD